MTINCEQIHTLKADADKSADNFKPTMVVDTKLIRCLLADRDADKALIAEQAKRIAELQGGQKKLIGWRASDYTDETSDPELAKNWAAAIGVLPIFEGDVNTKLEARALLAAREQEPVAYMCDGDDGREYNGHNEFSCGSRGIPLYAHPALASDAESLRIADALEVLLWPNMALGNKAVIQAAIDALRTHPAPVPVVPDVPDECPRSIIEDAELYDSVEDMARSMWSAMRAAMLNGGKS